MRSTAPRRSATSAAASAVGRCRVSCRAMTSASPVPLLEYSAESGIGRLVRDGKMRDIGLHLLRLRGRTTLGFQIVKPAAASALLGS